MYVWYKDKRTENEDGIEAKGWKGQGTTLGFAYTEQRRVKGRGAGKGGGGREREREEKNVGERERICMKIQKVSKSVSLSGVQ